METRRLAHQPAETGATNTATARKEVPAAVIHAGHPAQGRPGTTPWM